MQRVWLGDEAQRPNAAGINLARHIRHLLVGKIVLGRDNGEDDASWALHVPLHHVLDGFGLIGRLFSAAGLEQARQVDHCEMRLVRAGQLDSQNIVAELVGVIR